MRKTVAGLFISLDGVVESPQDWHFPYLNEEMGAAVGVQMVESDTTLLGRRTYEEFAAYWSQQGSGVPFADEINGAQKVVASRSLETADWQNSTVLGGNLADGVPIAQGAAREKHCYHRQPHPRTRTPARASARRAPPPRPPARRRPRAPTVHRGPRSPAPHPRRIDDLLHRRPEPDLSARLSRSLPQPSHPRSRGAHPC